MNSAMDSSSSEKEGPEQRTNSCACEAISRLGRVVMIAALSIGSLATLRAANYLLGAILNVPAQVGIPLIPLLATFTWIVPLLVVPRLRDIGSFRFPLVWPLLLLLPVAVLNWVFSMYFVIPESVRWSAWLWFRLSTYGIATAIFEELVFRGYAFRRVPEAHPRLVVFVSAFCFAVAHLLWITERPLSDVLGNLAFAFVVAIALGVIRLTSRSIAWCILLHAAINAAMPTDQPGLKHWTLCVLTLVAIGSSLTLWFHPAFQRCGLRHRVESH